MRTLMISRLAVTALLAAACSSTDIEPVSSTEQALCSATACAPSGTVRNCGEGNLNGIQQCLSDGTWSACYPLDHLVPCKPGDQRACSMAPGTDGWQTCRNTQLWGACSCTGPRPF